MRLRPVTRVLDALWLPSHGRWDGAMWLNCYDLCNQESWATRKDYGRIAQSAVVQTTHKPRGSRGNVLVLNANVYLIATSSSVSMPAPTPGSPSRLGNAPARCDRQSARSGRNPGRPVGPIIERRSCSSARSFRLSTSSGGRGRRAMPKFSRFVFCSPTWYSDRKARDARAWEGACIACGRGDIPLDARRFRRRERLATCFDSRTFKRRLISLTNSISFSGSCSTDAC